MKYILDDESVEDASSSSPLPPPSPQPPLSPQPRLSPQPPPLSSKNTLTTPQEFENFTNELEICSWLVEKPHILRLANQMMKAKETPPDISCLNNTFINSSEGSSKCPSVISGGPTNDDLNNEIDDVRIMLYFIIRFVLFIII